ncbi:MAG: NAD(P)H-binding protein [Aestuariibacter sp.]
MQQQDKRTALILGASGLVGSELLQLLLQDERYQQVTCFLRQPLSAKVIDCHGDKIEPIVVDFDHLSDYLSYFSVDHIYVCLGTTIKQAGSKEDFKRVDYDYVYAAATCASEAGAGSFVWISSIGANPSSRNFYLRTKGELERDINGLGQLQAQCVQPSLLIGKRPGFRLGEWLAIKLRYIYQWLLTGPLIKYKPIEASEVARLMIARQIW